MEEIDLGPQNGGKQSRWVKGVWQYACLSGGYLVLENMQTKRKENAMLPENRRGWGQPEGLLRGRMYGPTQNSVKRLSWGTETVRGDDKWMSKRLSDHAPIS